MVSIAAENSAATVLIAVRDSKQVAQAVVVPSNDVVDDGSRLGDNPIAFRNRGRLAVDLVQLHRRKIDVRVLLVESDLVTGCSSCRIHRTRCDRDTFWRRRAMINLIPRGYGS
jgi:hypothetical protein